ncbi:MAG TPA: DUF5050 domain-containing protein [Opitutaceae bacterium]|nr:DUF5050 domain-containing protein [Opitutaceae bacterium]
MTPHFRVATLGRFALASLAASSLSLALQAASIGQFEEQTDVGSVHIPGSALYDLERQVYTIESSGANMWTDHDAFHFVWKKISGDFIVQAQVEFIGQGGDPHRKAGIIVRSSLDARSAHVNAVTHGDGSTALQFRRSEGATTEEKRLASNGATVLELSRHGNTYTVSAAKFGEPYATQTLDSATLGDSVYVGLYVCAHNDAVSEKALLRNVRLIRPAKDDFRPYRDYIGSEIELMNVATGQRRMILHAEDSLQAPNWTPDNKRLVYNHNGRMFNLDLATLTPSSLDTGEQVRCNNDHALSLDGRQLGISSGQVSTVYILPSAGGAPKQITQKNPSYFHSWSPDGKYLLYTGLRGKEPGDIYRISVDGGEEQRLTTAEELDDGSEYTPDGKYIYFNSNRTGRMQLWRMKPDGSEQEQITHDDFNNWFPHISPDGKSIVFLSYGAEIASGDHPFYKHVYIRKLPIDGGTPNVVAYLYGGQGSMNVNSWSPDSASIAFVSNSDKL